MGPPLTSGNMTYDNTRHVATGATPHSLLFTWPRAPATLLHPVQSPMPTVQDRQRAFGRARQSILDLQEAANDRAKAAHTLVRRYQPGEFVWLKNTPTVGDNPKFRAKWIGPFEVIDHNEQEVVTILRKGAPYRINAARTKLCHFPPPR